MSTAMSSLRRRVAEQDREVERLTTELEEAREEAAAASGTAAEAALASSRQVGEETLIASRATASRRSMSWYSGSAVVVPV